MSGAPRGRYYSVSSCETYEECPQRWEFEYKRRERRFRLAPQHWRFGTVVHAAMAAGLEARRAAGGRGPLINHRSEALAALEESWTREEMPAHGGELDRAIGMVTDTLEAFEISADDILGVEMKIVQVTPDGTIFIGYCDLAHRLGPSTLEILDWKVTSSKKTAVHLTHDYQLCMYGWGLRQEFPWAQTVYGTHYYPPINERVSVRIDEDAIAANLARFEAVVEMTETDEHKPRPGEYCSWCAFVDRCPAMSLVPREQLAF